MCFFQFAGGFIVPLISLSFFSGGGYGGSLPVPDGNTHIRQSCATNACLGNMECRICVLLSPGRERVVQLIGKLRLGCWKKQAG